MELLLKKNPEDLFTANTLKELRHEFVTLAKKWHPDVNKGVNTSAVFEHISALYQQGISKFNKGIWDRPCVFSSLKFSGESFSFPYQKVHKIDIGFLYISPTFITYIFDKDMKPFIAKTLKQFKSFTYKTEEMRKEMAKYLPTKYRSFKLEDNRIVVQIQKTEDLILLKDLLEYCNGTVDPKHVAWILSSLYNICCYLSFCNLTHLNISIDTCFVSTKYHSSALLGGWWYCLPIGGKLKQISQRTYQAIPFLCKQPASAKIDLELVRFLGRELLGDKVGSSLPKRDIPAFFVDWLRNAVSHSNAIDEYSAWNRIKKESYENKFIKWDISSDDIYIKE